MPISEEKPKICCQYPFEPCKSVKTYNDEIILKVLKNKFFVYKEASERYSEPGYIRKNCGYCDAVCLANTRLPDYMCQTCYIFNCTTCSTPYYCTCYLFHFYNNPINFNYFFWKPKSKRLYLTDYKFKNEELKPQYIVNFLNKKFKDEDIYSTCPVCETKIEKTQDCNAVRHCHVEMCNVCGMFSNIGEKLHDHWSARGSNGCPRWYNDPCLLDNVPTFQCTEGLCYGHMIGNCKEEAHQQGVKDYIMYKKRKLMYHYIINVPKDIRDAVLCKLSKLQEYLPTKEQLGNVDSYSNFQYVYKNY
jgi:hypothetical protein